MTVLSDCIQNLHFWLAAMKLRKKRCCSSMENATCLDMLLASRSEVLLLKWEVQIIVLYSAVPVWICSALALHRWLSCGKCGIFFTIYSYTFHHLIILVFEIFSLYFLNSHVFRCFLYCWKKEVVSIFHQCDMYIYIYIYDMSFSELVIIVISIIVSDPFTFFKITTFF